MVLIQHGIQKEIKALLCKYCLHLAFITGNMMGMGHWVIVALSHPLLLGMTEGWDQIFTQLTQPIAHHIHLPTFLSGLANVTLNPIFKLCTHSIIDLVCSSVWVYDKSV